MIPSIFSSAIFFIDASSLTVHGNTCTLASVRLLNKIAIDSSIIGADDIRIKAQVFNSASQKFL
jgi:hypothetical protein